MIKFLKQKKTCRFCKKEEQAYFDNETCHSCEKISYLSMCESRYRASLACANAYQHKGQDFTNCPICFKIANDAAMKVFLEIKGQMNV